MHFFSRETSSLNPNLFHGSGGIEPLSLSNLDRPILDTATENLLDRPILDHNFIETSTEQQEQSHVNKVRNVISDHLELEEGVTSSVTSSPFSVPKYERLVSVQDDSPPKVPKRNYEKLTTPTGIVSNSINFNF